MLGRRHRHVDAVERAAGSPEIDPSLGIEELFRSHAPAVASLGLAMLQSVDEADELVQDVFLRAWRAVDRPEDPEGARPWVRTIAVRVARNRLRQKKLGRLVFRADSPDFDQIASSSVLPEHRELVRQLCEVLDRLPIELRLAWVLRYVEAETVENVAALCGWSISTAKRRIGAAHARVTASLKAMTPITSSAER